MLQVCGGADFRQESLAAERGAEVGMQHLDGDIWSCLRSCARYTVAMPPAPSSRSIR